MFLSRTDDCEDLLPVNGDRTFMKRFHSDNGHSNEDICMDISYHGCYMHFVPIACVSYIAAIVFDIDADKGLSVTLRWLFAVFIVCD